MKNIKYSISVFLVLVIVYAYNIFSSSSNGSNFDRIILHIGDLKMAAYQNNNEQIITIDTTPVIIDGTTFVPIRIISELFGCEVTLPCNL